jgi:signal transduction histidine kinase
MNFLLKSDKISSEDYQFYNITYYGYILGGLDHLIFLFFFYFIGIEPMIYFNIFSVAVFFSAFILSNNNKLNLAFLIVLIEVFLHAYLSVYYLGFKSGFQYYLFALSTIVMFNPKWSYKIKIPFIAFLALNMILIKEILFYGKSTIIQNAFLIDYVQYFNILASFIMFALIAFYYDSAVKKSRKTLTEKNTELNNKNEQIIEQFNNLEILTTKLKLSNDSKDKFFSIIAHDLKNPLTALLLNTEMLTLYFEKFNSIQIKENINKIHNSSKNLKELLDNLLEWARSQTGSIDFTPELISINEKIDKIINLLSINIKNKELTVIKKIPENISIIADKNMLNTVIRNLLSNAVKFTPIGGKISITVSQNADEMFFEFTDTGVGIDADRLSKIFNIDSNVSTCGTSNEKGTGLGLILCKEFIERHSGHIYVESIKDKGSTFTFSIPTNLSLNL